MILPAMLARTDGRGPNSLCMIGAAPAVYLLIGSGVWEAYRFVWSRRLSLRWRKRPGLTEQEAGIAAAGAVVMAGLILLQGLATYRTFFVEWAAELGFNRAYHAEWAEAAEVLNELESDSDMVYILPYPLHNEHFSDRHFGFEYLYQGAAPAYVLAALTPHNLARKVEKVLSEDGMFSTVRLLDWRNQLVGGDARAKEHTLSLLWKYGRYRGSDEYESFHIHTFEDISLDRPWALYDQLQSVAVYYDEGISLHGFVVGQSAGNLSPHSEVDLRDHRPLWVALQWQTAPELEIDFSISLRLHKADGDLVFQEDFVLTNSVRAPTSHWSPDESVDTFFYFDLPADFQPGEYDLRLVVYDFETQKPTVELGVWEPELTLTRLRVAADQQ